MHFEFLDMVEKEFEEVMSATLGIAALLAQSLLMDLTSQDLAFYAGRTIN